MPITVKTEVYEGPLDVLLELVEKRKLLINDISLAAVTDEYIEQINAMVSLPVSDTAEFVALAGDETRDIKELEYRLALYQLIKDAARGFHQLDLPHLSPGNPREREPLFIPDPALTPEGLQTAAEQLIEGFPALLILPKVEVKKIISLEEMVERMAGRIQSAIRMSFK